MNSSPLITLTIQQQQHHHTHTHTHTHAHVDDDHVCTHCGTRRHARVLCMCVARVYVHAYTCTMGLVRKVTSGTAVDCLAGWLLGQMMLPEICEKGEPRFVVDFVAILALRDGRLRQHQTVASSCDGGCVSARVCKCRRRRRTTVAPR